MANLPPLAVQIVSPKDVNALVLQYAQQDRANWFYAATQTAVSPGAGLSATATFGLYNPFVASISDTSVNLIVRSIQVAVSVDPAAAVNILYTKVTGAGTNPGGLTLIANGSGFGPIVKQQGLNTSYTATGVPFSAATLSSTPFIIRIATNVLTTTAPQAAIDDPVNGQIILAPGDQFAVQASAACSLYASIVWEEMPVW